jgi:integrase/recombinase XerD
VKYNYSKEDVKFFIKWKYKRADYPLKKLKLQFLDDFDYYLKVEKLQKQITINKGIQRFRRSIRVAVSEGCLGIDPFMLYKNKKMLIEIVFLSAEELEKLKKYDFTQPTLKRVRDLFIFSCYTGLAYNELK